MEIVFQLVPASEAPSEMLMHFPQFRVLNMTEDVTHNMHNLYTIRGSEVRDGNLWSRYIGEAVETRVIALSKAGTWRNAGGSGPMGERPVKPVELCPTPENYGLSTDNAGNARTGGRIERGPPKW